MGADELARLTGLTPRDVAFWLPRLPGPVLASAPATVDRLRQIAGLRRGGVVHPLSSTATVIRAATGQPFPEAPGLGRARGAVARRQRTAEQRARDAARMRAYRAERRDDPEFLAREAARVAAYRARRRATIPTLRAAEAQRGAPRGPAPRAGPLLYLGLRWPGESGAPAAGGTNGWPGGADGARRGWTDGSGPSLCARQPLETCHPH